MDSERNLILRAKKKDIAAFEQLLNTYRQSIYSTCYRMAGNPEDAADMAQEVALKIYRNMDKFRGNSKFSTWVYRITVNACLDELKKIQRRQTFSTDKEIETSDGAMTADIPDRSPTPEQAMEIKELQQAINTAIGRLSEEHRTAIVLRDIEGFSYEEIAEVFQCSVGTVKSRISRARKNLREILEQDRELFAAYFVK